LDEKWAKGARDAFLKKIIDAEGTAGGSPASDDEGV
jgi:hypothetical protein